MPSALSVTSAVEEKTGVCVIAAHQALMSRVALSRDREAFKLLFTYYGPRIKALMMKGGADQTLAEDLVQDVMMTVWRKVHLYSPERGTVSAWIFTIARNARIDRLRKGTSRSYEDLDNVDIVSEEADGEEMMCAAQRAERVTEALKALPDAQRVVIELAYLEDVPQTKIAERLGLPLGTVKSRMRLAYAKLRDQLEELNDGSSSS